MITNDVFKKGSSILKGGFSTVTQFIRDSPIKSGAIAGGSVLAGTGIVQIIRSRKKRKTKAKKRTKSKRKVKSYFRSKRRKGKRRYKYARTAGKRKDTSTRRIRMTKYGQPYVILRSGKARFISRRSARMSRRRKGGRY